MKSWILYLSLGAAVSAADILPGGAIEASVQSRMGFDSNPIGTSGTSASALGHHDSLIYVAGVSLGLGWTEPGPSLRSLKLTYAAEVVQYDRWQSENFTTHRLGLTGQLTVGAWRFSGEASTLLVAGSRDTLISVPSVNANAITLWRERRSQLQHRIKVQSQSTYGECLVRATGTLLAYDYRTREVVGKVAFADRSDVQVALDLGWTQSPNSLWFIGARTGHQDQAWIALPNCSFDYSNDYQRLAVGWEGKLPGNTTLALAAGPDFRRYDGVIDPRIFLGGRDRTSSWIEGNFSAKPTSRLTITGKATRMDWLSSTGKSAYIDTCVEAGASWMLNPAWTARVSGKLHRCDYYPVYRDDWEAFFGAGLTWKFSSRIVLTLDLLRQNAWNHLGPVPEREFQRFAAGFGVGIKL